MISKNIFQSWWTKELPSSVQFIINNMKKINPEYEYHLYTDNDMDEFVNNNFPGEISECYNKLNIIVAKVDFWRYLILYKYGGVYVDMDSMINKPLRDLINDEDEAIISAEKNDGMYVQWGLIFSHNHPILKRTIELVVDNIKNNKHPNDIHKMTGPTVYSNAINDIHKSIFNDHIFHNQINHTTDMTYKTANISYRIFGIDYNGYFSFDNGSTNVLKSKNPHWTIVQRVKPLLKS